MTRARRVLAHLALTLAMTLPGALSLSPARAESEDVWSSLKSEVFGEATIIEDQDVIAIDAPERAEDAAVTPITIRLGTAASPIRRVHLIIDNNPSPVAAVFDLGPASAAANQTIATRVRVDRFTDIRAIAETADGRLHMTKRFVKASGGCSAPASKDGDAALTGLGKTQITTRATGGQAEATVMVRHPNFSGLQIDQTTHGYTPARFVNEIEIMSDGHRVMKIEAGISISENPHFRLSYMPGAEGRLDVTIKETGGLTITSTHKDSGT